MNSFQPVPHCHALIFTGIFRQDQRPADFLFKPANVFLHKLQALVFPFPDALLPADFVRIIRPFLCFIHSTSARMDRPFPQAFFNIPGNPVQSLISQQSHILLDKLPAGTRHITESSIRILLCSKTQGRKIRQKICFHRKIILPPLRYRFPLIQMVFVYPGFKCIT